MPRPLLFVLIGVVSAVLSWSVQEPDAEAALLEEAAQLQRSLDDQASRLTKDAAYWAHELAGSGPEEWMRRYADVLEKDRERYGTILLGYMGDSLVCWSGQVPHGSMLDTGTTTAHVVLHDAIHQHAVSSIGLLHMHALAPVWNTPPIENRYLKRGFHPSLKAPIGLGAKATDTTGPILFDAAGSPMLRVAWRDGAMEVGPWILLKLALVVLAAFSSLIALWIVGQKFVRTRGPWTGTLFFVGVLLTSRWAMLSFIPSAPFDRLPLFDPATYAASFIFPSLGDLLLNSALLVLAAWFARSAMRRDEKVDPWIMGIAGAWILLFAAAAWVTNTIIGLVNDSSVDLDLYHVQRLNMASAVAVISIALIFTAWLLLADACIRAFVALRPIWRALVIGAIVLAISVLTHHLYGVRDTVLFLWPTPLLLLLLHAHRTRFRFMHVVIGLGTLAAFSSHILTKYTQAREQSERLVLADRLSVREDPVVELLFREVAPALRKDPDLYRLLTATEPCTAGDLDVHVGQVYFGGYWERYDVRVYAFGPDGEPRCSTGGSAPRSLDADSTAFSDFKAAADMPDLYFDQGGSEGPFYHARMALMPFETAAPAQLILELHPRSAEQSLGFPDLLLSGDDQLTRRTQRYALARYEQGLLVDQSSNTAVPLRWERQLGPDGMLWYAENGMEYLAKGSASGTVLTMGTPQPGPIDQATTFSYLFTLFSVLLALAMLARTLWRYKGIPSFGIGAKVRLALLLFALVGLFFFGLGAQRLLTRQYTQRTEANSLEKARSAHMELQQKLEGQPVLDDAHSRYLEHLLAQLSNVLFSDITVYDRQGALLASSRPQVFSSGLLSDRMDAVAYTRLVIEQESALVHQESIGSAEYLSAYLPLRNRRGEVLGYLALPSFTDQHQREEERSGVLVAVVNLFVLFFALSVLVAVFISNWTTRPLDVLKRALAGVALGSANQPIRYRGEDEVGQLVEVYNRKVEELRESAEKLARSERESAWREMARQVAHEVKNPLTPMKLGIQHFQRTWDPASPDARERLEKFSNSLVQQIDVLNGVATAFSQFAQMPIAVPQPLELSDVARVAVQVFTATPGVSITMEEGGPLPVLADREQLLRVLNNLLKNAVQAIPEDRKGSVVLRLGREGNSAILEVKDNGEGIPVDARERIFSPSFTTKTRGMGLGLAMVKRIVENAGGTVRFETVEGEGTSFFVTFPLRP